MSTTTVTDLRTEYAHNPLGIAVTRPRLFWRLDAGHRRGARQTAYQVLVGRRPDGPPDLWDSGKVASDWSAHVVYEGPALKSAERAWWRVRIWDEDDQVSEDSARAWWETGLLERGDWRGEWIGAALVGGPRTTVPCPFLRRTFTLDKPARSARLYVTALGLHECHLNGSRVGADVLTPGWTDYGTRVQYQVYDVTEMLQTGENVLGAILGDGWYCGHVGWHDRQHYGDRPRLLAQLVVTDEDGGTETIATDASWKTAFGPLLEADLLMGESYDARLEMPGWDAPGFPDAGWHAAATFADPGIEISAMRGPTVRATQEIIPPTDPVGSIVDLGQNMVGRVRLRVTGPRGTTVRMRFAEVLEGGPAEPTGGLYTANLRGAKQTDYYTLRGDPDGEVYESRFTFHGFRYVEVTGLPAPPTRETITGVVLHSETPHTGSFECSDPLINQLQKNIDWGQRGNFVDIPTDCPQRDERLGWTGDAQVFIRTAAFNRDVAGFFTKWQQDLADSQSAEGAFPMVVPRTEGADGGPAWADAGVICPWTICLCYGDTRLLEEHYPSLVKFMDFLQASSRDHVRCYDGYPGFTGFGDWLALDGETVEGTMGHTPKDLIGTAFFAHDAALLARIAALLGHDADAAKYVALAETVKSAFNAHFVAPDGTLAGGTQTAYVLALHFGLLPEALRPAAAEALVRDIEARGTHLSTGFVGSPYLAQVLTETGHLDTAYALLHQKTWPSWLYAVTQGATTIWERWDGWTHDKGFQTPGMNSFNHYAYGAIGAWLYATVAGIDLDPERPGYKHIVMHPRPGGGLTSARAALNSPCGLIESAWRLDGAQFHWEITVPANALATVTLPSRDGTPVMEDDTPLSDGLTRRPGVASLELGAGRYVFTSTLPEPA